MPNAWDNRRLAEYCRRLRAQYPIDEREGRILFVQIPQVILGSFNREIALRRAYYAFPPTGLQYLCEAIRHRGVEVRILDLNYELLKRVFEDEAFDHNNWAQILEQVLNVRRRDAGRTRPGPRRPCQRRSRSHA